MAEAQTIIDPTTLYGQQFLLIDPYTGDTVTADTSTTVYVQYYEDLENGIYAYSSFNITINSAS